MNNLDEQPGSWSILVKVVQDLYGCVPSLRNDNNALYGLSACGGSIRKDIFVCSDELLVIMSQELNS